MANSLSVHNNGMIVYVADGVSESYSLTVEPSESGLLVKQARQQVLQSINLNQMFINLDNSVTLLDITYNAVNGMEGGLSPKIARLQSEFLDALSHSITVTQGFEVGARTTIEDLISAYGFLTKPMYAKLPKDKNGVVLAFKMFQGIKNKASMMRTDAEQLAVRFGGLKNQTTDANQLIISQKDLSYDKRDKMLAELNKMNAMIDGLVQVKEELDIEVDEYTNQYNKMSKKIEKEEARAFKLALASTIISGVSSIIGSINPVGIASTAVAMETGVAAPIPSSSTSKPDTGNDAIKSKHDASIKEADGLRAKIEKNNQTIEEIKKKQAEATTDEEKETLLNQLNQEVAARQENEKKRDTAQAQADVYSEALGGATDGMGAIAQRLDGMSEKSDAKAEGLYDQLDKIADRKAAVAKERRDTIMQLSSLTKSIEYATTQEADLELAINALITAVGCMRLVEVYLADIALFWRNVEKFCDGMVEQIGKIAEYSEVFTDVEDYREFFTDADFTVMYLYNMVSWAALRSICVEYLAAFNNAYTNHKAAIGQPEHDRQTHWKRARELAAGMSAVFDQQLSLEGVTA